MTDARDTPGSKALNEDERDQYQDSVDFFVRLGFPESEVRTIPVIGTIAMQNWFEDMNYTSPDKLPVPINPADRELIEKYGEKVDELSKSGWRLQTKMGLCIPAPFHDHFNPWDNEEARTPEKLSVYPSPATNRVFAQFKKDYANREAFDENGIEAIWEKGPKKISAQLKNSIYNVIIKPMLNAKLDRGFLDAERLEIQAVLAGESDAEARRAAEEQARRAAEEQARRAAEEQARRAAEEQARRAAEEQARRAAEEQARRAAEEQARRAAEEQARRAAEEQARRAAEELRARHAAQVAALERAQGEEMARMEEEVARRAAEQSRKRNLSELSDSDIAFLRERDERLAGRSRTPSIGMNFAWDGDDLRFLRERDERLAGRSRTPSVDSDDDNIFAVFRAKRIRTQGNLYNHTAP